MAFSLEHFDIFLFSSTVQVAHAYRVVFGFQVVSHVTEDHLKSGLLGRLLPQHRPKLAGPARPTLFLAVHLLNSTHF